MDDLLKISAALVVGFIICLFFLAVYQGGKQNAEDEHAKHYTCSIRAEARP